MKIISKPEKPNLHKKILNSYKSKERKLPEIIKIEYRNPNKVIDLKKGVIKIIVVQSSFPWRYLYKKAETEDSDDNTSYTYLILKDKYYDVIPKYYSKTFKYLLERNIDADIICFPEFVYNKNYDLRKQLKEWKEKVNIITGTYISTSSLNTCEMYIQNYNEPIIQSKLYPNAIIGENFKSAPKRILHCVKTNVGNIACCICIDIKSEDIHTAIKNRIGTEEGIDIIFSPSYNPNPSIHAYVQEISKKLKTCIVFVNDATTLVSSKVFALGEEIELTPFKTRPDLFFFELDLNKLRKSQRD